MKVKFLLKKSKKYKNFIDFIIISNVTVLNAIIREPYAKTFSSCPQELLFRCCICWCVPLVQRLRSSSSNVVPAGRISTYHSLHMQRLGGGSWGRTVAVQNMWSWHLSVDKQSVQLHLVSRWNVYIRKMKFAPQLVL